MSEAHGDPARDLLEEYALGMLDGAERATVDARLKTDPELQRELAALQEALTALAFGAPVTPGPELKQRVMARVATRAFEAEPAVLRMRQHRRARTRLWLGAALAASLLLSAKLAIDLRRAHQDASSAELATEAGRRELAHRDSLIAQLTDPGVELVTMAATGAKRPAVQAYLNRAQHVMTLSAASLETLPPGRAYQLWFIVRGKPVPSVTFRPDASGRAVVSGVPMPADAVDATAITQEPEGGSAAPTSAILFVGKRTTE